jgi:microcystin-dependent protein
VSGKLDWLEIQVQALPERNIIALTHVGAILIMACNAFYRQRYYWQYGGEPVDDTQWDEIGHAIGLMEHELMSGLIGVILPHVIGALSDLNMLPCDGAIYNRVDYPLLYDALENTYQIDADTFYVPDLRGKFPLGQSASFLIADEGGTETETLTVAQMPEHTHDNDPHAHSEIIPVSTIINGGLEAPATAAIPSPSTTGLASISINPEGGGEEHNNMPPYHVVLFAIIAG